VLLLSAIRVRVYARCSLTCEGRPQHELVATILRDAGLEDVSVYRGAIGFDRASALSRLRFSRFHAGISVVEAVGSERRIRSALIEVREILTRGIVTLERVRLYELG